MKSYFFQQAVNVPEQFTMKNQDLQHQCKQLVEECEHIETDEAHMELQKEILKLYITIRGFRFTSKFMEEYKNSKKNNYKSQKVSEPQFKTIQSLE